MARMREEMKILISLLLLVVVVGLERVVAHPLAITTCEIQLSETKAEVTMNILVADLVIYQGLKPKNEGTYYEYDETISAAEKHEEFILNYFFIRDGDGNLVKGKKVSTDTSSLDRKKGSGIHPVEVMRYAIIYKFEYEFSTPPGALNFSHIFGGSENVQPETLELLIYRDGILVEAPAKIGPKVPHVLTIDWTKPAPPLPNDWKERKRLAEKALLESLGMPQFSGVYSHLYIEDSEIRHEILLPLVILETLITIDKKDPDFVEVSEQVASRAKIEKYFKENHPVVIDGKRVLPELSRVDFYPLETRDFMSIPKPQRVSSYNTRIGIIASYPTKQTPQSLRFQWDGFNRFLSYLKVNVYEFDAAPNYKYLIDQENVFVWDYNGSRVTLDEKSISAKVYVSAELMSDGFEKDPDIEGRIICPSTKAAIDYWSSLWSKNTLLKLNDKSTETKIKSVTFLDLDYQELPIGSMSGKVDLSEVLVLTEFEATLEGEDSNSVNNFELSWAGLDSLNQNPITRILFEEAKSPSTTIPVVLNKSESAISWSNALGIGGGNLNSLPMPGEIPTVKIPKMSVIGGMVFIWTIFVWLRTKFKVSPQTISASIVSIVFLVLMITSEPTEIEHPFKKPEVASKEDKENIFRSLHSNIYRAFRLPNESQRFDYLSNVASGPLLNELYLEIQKSLVNESTGGASARIDSVNIVKSSFPEESESSIELSKQGFLTSAQWEVAGTIEHWGHVHTRTNSYTAQFGIDDIEKSWKMVSYQLEDQKQVGEPYIGIRLDR